MTGADCPRLQELGPEIALGIADGADRAWALEHLADCPECRARIERLSALADELLLVAPGVEPPAGFEGRVVDSIHPRARSRARRLALPVAAALAAAACAAAAVWFALGDDRELAGSYRETLAVAHGQYFDAAPLELPGGQPVGYAYGYQGRTSWMLAVVYDGVPDGRYELEVVTDEGRRLPLRPLVVAGGHGSAGGATAVDYDDVSQLRLLDAGGRELADSDLHE
ncbi:MAG: hypothetical protein QOI10_1033 [Solirubrobacterales bacterium]|jgi:hypothetical protein|nr:hypothetical protein [Solirubrobacterales bacterium]